MIKLLISSLLIGLLYADEYESYGSELGEGVAGCCECTESSEEPYCNEECDNTICSYDPYCCNEEYGSWDGICADAAVKECDGTAGDYDYYGPGDYDYDYYGDYDQCNCDEICYGQESEDWEFEYEEVPPCIIDNCGQQLDTCAYNDQCVEGIEGMVSSCYADNEDPMQCMDGLVQDTENNGVNELCDGDTECGADLKSLGECVVNSANYGFCPEEEYKKLKLKSVLKTVKKRSRQRKRKSAAAKQKLKRKSRRSKKTNRSKKRGKRASKLRKSRRKLVEDTAGSDYYYDDYENPEYDYGCYCDCDEEEEVPDCVEESCGEQLEACGGQDDCIAGVEGVISQCYEDNDSPQECMDELMKESNGAQAIELCNGNEEAAGDLQALGACVINSANYGFCSEDEYKKLKIKALVKATKKVRAKKGALKQRKARSSKRARSAKARAQRKRQRSRKVRSRSRRAVAQRQRQRRARSQRQRRAKSQRSRKARKARKSRKSRRSLQSAGVEGCCECTESSEDPYCNEECDNTICSYDPYCCNEEYGSWDWICANAAVQECDGTAPSYDDYGTGGCDSYNYYDYDPNSYQFEDSYDYGTDSYYDGGAGYTFDSYNDGGYDPNSYQFEDSFYDGGAGEIFDSYNDGGYDPNSYQFEDSYGGDSYQMQDSYDYGGYDSYDSGFDSYYPPKGRSKRVRPRSRARSQRTRRVRPQSRARAERQRQGRPLKRSRGALRRKRIRRARR